MSALGIDETHFLQKTVIAYDETGHKRIEVFCTEGDVISWKRNGSRSTFTARILGWNQAMPKKVFVQPINKQTGASEGRPVWINKRSVHNVLSGKYQSK